VFIEAKKFAPFRAICCSPILGNPNFISYRECGEKAFSLLTTGNAWAISLLKLLPVAKPLQSSPKRLTHRHRGGHRRRQKGDFWSVAL